MRLVIGIVCTLAVCACGPSSSHIDVLSGTGVYAFEDAEPVQGYVVTLRPDYAQPASGVAEEFSSREAKEHARRPARAANYGKIASVAARHGIIPRATYVSALVGFTAPLTDAEADELLADPDVQDVFPDVWAEFGAEASLQTVTESSLGQYFVDRSVAFAGAPTLNYDSSKFIWVIDSGIDLDHQDLNVITQSPYATSITTNTPNDEFGHGTLVAGIAAARFNTIGVSGVAAGAPVVPVRVDSESFFGQVGAQLSDVLSGLEHVATYNLAGDVVNISVAGSASSDCANQLSGFGQTMREAVQRLGFENTWVVIGSGNNQNCTGADTNLPACVNGFKVLTVGAIGHTASSNTITCDPITAWGTSVDWATIAGNTSTYKNGLYAVTGGTSMATPVVAGIVYVRNAGPVLNGNVSCCSANRNIPNLSTLSTNRYKVDLQLLSFVVSNVGDLDGTEDLFGHLDFQASTTTDGKNIDTTVAALWSRTEANAQSFANGTHLLSPSPSRTIATNLTYFELLRLKVKVGGVLSDDEGFLASRPFSCTNCTNGSVIEELSRDPRATASIQQMPDTTAPRLLNINTNDNFSMTFGEGGNLNNGAVVTRWRLWVTQQ